MEPTFSILDMFQGVSTLVDGFQNDPVTAFGRVFLIALGIFLFYLGRKGVLEALLMIPMGLGMATVNAAVMFFYTYDPSSGLVVPGQTEGIPGTLFIAPLAEDPNALIRVLQINWLQPIYTYMFSNGLIACL
ncbi:MAG: hypothetical protein EA356_00880, partial [Geminicoccaceae bacterium]